MKTYGFIQSTEQDIVLFALKPVVDPEGMQRVGTHPFIWKFVIFMCKIDKKW